MTKASIERLTARYVAQFKDAAAGSDDEILRGFICALAEDVARSVFLAVGANGPTSIRDTPLDLQARFALGGIDFAQRVRANLYPGGRDEPITEAELIAARAYWGHLEELLQAASAGGRA